MPTKHDRARALDERACRIICPISASMVGVCLTGISLLHVVVAVRHRMTVADDLLSFDALLFLFATLSSYFALRAATARRLHWMERVADRSFIVAMIVLTAACFLITYTLT